MRRWAQAKMVARVTRRALARLGVRSPLEDVRPLHDPDFPLVLLFTPKAGCTSLVKWFFFHAGKLEAATAHNKWVHRYRTEVFQRQPGYAAETRRLLQTHERPIVKLVRNPYERAVSSFLQMVRNANMPTRARHRTAAVVGAARERAGKPQGDPLCLSFRDFMRHLAAVGVSIGDINGHVAQQYLPGEEDYVSRIIRLEHFAEAIRQLEAEFGLDASPLEDFTTSRHHNNSDPRLAAAWTSGANAKWLADVDVHPQHLESNILPAYLSFYDEETERLVYTCYGDDFRHYGYPRVVPDGAAEQTG